MKGGSVSAHMNGGVGSAKTGFDFGPTQRPLQLMLAELDS